jgi:hypothetical protein
MRGGSLGLAVLLGPYVGIPLEEIKGGRTMRRIFYLLPILGVLPCLLTLVSSADSAPQQAVIGIQAVAWVVIPYCVARALDELCRAGQGAEKSVADILATHTKLLASIANSEASSEGVMKT